MSVLITVGTTKFEDLIERISQEDILCLLHQMGYSKIIMQKGNGSYIPDKKIFNNNKIDIDIFDYIPSLKPYIEQADLIIGHAGAGTIIECLRAGKKLVVVINEKLMNNHQLEIANAMSSEHYLLQANCTNLISVIQDSNSFNPLPFSDANPQAFADFIDSQLF
ncbi:hypothetical protein WA158_002867 [Blastocystis sp. Blastoise]